MKKILTTLALVAVTGASFAQGIVNFGNSSSTLISVNGVGMPGSSVSTFYFAVFMAPSTTVTQDNLTTATFGDSSWGSALYTTVNHATAAGRLATTAGTALIPGFAGGSTADFIIRGWSANAGATYAEALLAFQSGLAGAYFGTSEIANNIVLGDGGALPTPTLFGAGVNQVGGFALTTVVPEPSSMALAGLGAASLLIFRRRK